MGIGEYFLTRKKGMEEIEHQFTIYLKPSESDTDYRKFRLSMIVVLLVLRIQDPQRLG